MKNERDNNTGVKEEGRSEMGPWGARMSGWRFALSGMRLTIYFCHRYCAYTAIMAVGLMNLSDHLFISCWPAASHESLGMVLRAGWLCDADKSVREETFYTTVDI